MTADVKAADQQFSGYRWVVLITCTLVSFMVSFCQFQPAFFAQDIMTSMNIGNTEFATITSFPLLVGLFLAFVSGALADKFGIKKVLVVMLMITTAGAIGRYFCYDYVPLLLSSMLLGIAATFVNSNIAKLAMMWFPSKQIPVAVGIGTAMGSAGIAAAQVFNGMLFGDYHTAFLWGGIAMVVITVLWIVLGRDRAVPAAVDMNAEKAESAEQDSPQGPTGIKAVIKSRSLWLAGIGIFLFNGVNVAAGSFLITAFVVTWGTDAVLAGVISGLFTAGAAVGAAVLPAFISRTKAAKLLCIAVPIAAALLIYAGWMIDIYAVRVVLFFVAGLLFGIILAEFMGMPSILPEISNENAGAAGGLITTFMMCGSVVMPTLVITPICGDNYNMFIIVCCIEIALCAVIFALLPSMYRGENKQ